MSRQKPSIENRVQYLERMNRLLTGAIGGAVVLLLIGASSEHETVSAQAFQLIDDSGRVRAELTANDEATGLYIHDDSGTVRIGIVHFAHGGSGIALHGPHSKGAAVLYLKGDASLRFLDADGNITNQVPAQSP